MKLNGRRTIALLVVAVLLLIGPVAGMIIADTEDGSGPSATSLLMDSAAGIVAAGGGDRHEVEFRVDARYWWEVHPFNACEQLVEIATLIFARYFGVDVSRMNVEEFREFVYTIGPEGEEKAVPLFGYYAEKKGFELPSERHICEDKGKTGIAHLDPDCPLNRMTVREWLYNYMCPEGRNHQMGVIKRDISRVKEVTPEVWGNILNMTLAELFSFLEQLPHPEWRIASIEEVRQMEHVLAAFGRVPRAATRAELEQFIDKLERLSRALAEDKVARLDAGITDGWFQFPGAISMMGPSSPYSLGAGALRITVTSPCVPVHEMYKAISEKAERLFGIEDVPVIFQVASLVVRDIRWQSHCQSYPPKTIAPEWSDMPGYGKVWRPTIPGGVAMTCELGTGKSTMGFAVQESILWWQDEDLVITGHLRQPRRNLEGVHIYQPEAILNLRIGTVAYVSPWRSSADFARVAVCDELVQPYIHVGRATLPDGRRLAVFSPISNILGELGWFWDVYIRGKP